MLVEDTCQYLSDVNWAQIAIPVLAEVEDQPRAAIGPQNYKIVDDILYEYELRILIRRWTNDVRYMSSFSDMVSHEDYIAISNKDHRAISILLKELQHRPHYWFDALQTLIKENLGLNIDPIKKEEWGDLHRMAKAWLDWGKRNGHII